LKFLSILGSPRINGNTATALRWLEDEIRTTHHMVERVNVVDYQINGCVECYKCQKAKSGPFCSQKDDGNIVLKKMLSVDSLIFASPLFVWSFSGQMKLLLDRMFCLVKSGGSPDHYSALSGKSFVMLITCGGPLQKNSEEIQQIFKRMIFWFRAVNAGSLILPACGSPGQPDRSARQRAFDLAHTAINATTTVY
jgi:multimeric flavodoxin WrbA